MTSCPLSLKFSFQSIFTNCYFTFKHRENSNLAFYTKHLFKCGSYLNPVFILGSGNFFIILDNLRDGPLEKLQSMGEIKKKEKFKNICIYEQLMELNKSITVC